MKNYPSFFGVFTIVMLSLVITAVNAAVYPYTDKGLGFVINDDDPFAPTISFSNEIFDLILPATTSQKEAITEEVIIPQPFPNPPIVVERTKTFTFTLVPETLSLSELTVTGTTADIAPNQRDFDSGFLSTGLSFQVSGSWTISGPTETVSDTFVIPFNPFIRWEPRSLDTSLFPGLVTLDKELTVSSDLSWYNVSKIVDGESVEFRFPSHLYADSIAGVKLVVGETPIPAAIWLFGSGLIGLIGVARRKKV